MVKPLSSKQTTRVRFSLSVLNLVILNRWLERWCIRNLPCYSGKVKVFRLMDFMTTR